MIDNRRRRWLALVILLCSAASMAARGDDNLFPRPKQLESAIRFWTRVYTEVDTQGGFIHDADNLDIVYETVHYAGASRSVRRHAIERGVRHYREILTKLGHGAREGLSKDERRVLELWPAGTSNARFRRAANEIRFQLGQSDRFRAGLVRSGRWKKYIERILEANDVPLELAALPHVESSFDPTAYSKVGAAGLWQFTRSTGLRYMRIDHVVDERRDPYFSTNAAARLLKDNYDVLQSWPLAITAYNHGQAGMRRAVGELGTTDIGVIVEKYDSRTFGFASRNFYAAFLAAVDIDRHPEKYFGGVAVGRPLDTIVTSVPDYMDAGTLSHALGVPVSTLRELNPALMETVWDGDKFVPKDFPLRLPASKGAQDPGALLAAVPATERYAAQQPDVQHRVRRGETLSQIAAEYRVSLASLIRMNGLRDGDFIRAGQTLALPIRGQTPVVTLAQAGGDGTADDGQYVVRRGDSLARIARAFDVDVDDLLEANNISDKNLIIAGQTLRLPQAAGSAAGGLDGGGQDADAGVDAAPERPIAVAAVNAGAKPVAVPAVATPGTTPVPLATVASAPSSAASLAGPAAGLAAPGGADSAGDSADDGAADDSGGPGADTSGDGGTVTDNDEASLDSNALASSQADLAADPSDYSVTDRGTITVQSLETLGHYADWLEIRTQRLRDLNRLPFRRAVVIGQSLKLDFSRVSPDQFEQRRAAYHQHLQEDFFSRYRITTIDKHVVRRGESLWVLARHTYSVPVWLLRQYNPDLDLDHVSPGTVVKFPQLRPITDEDGGGDDDSDDGRPNGGSGAGDSSTDGDGVI